MFIWHLNDFVTLSSYHLPMCQVMMWRKLKKCFLERKSNLLLETSFASSLLSSVYRFHTPILNKLSCEKFIFFSIHRHRGKLPQSRLILISCHSFETRIIDTKDSYCLCMSSDKYYSWKNEVSRGVKNWFSKKFVAMLALVVVRHRCRLLHIKVVVYYANKINVEFTQTAQHKLNCYAGWLL